MYLKSEDGKKIDNLVKNEKGITLIALMITIIVLLILAGVSISLTIIDNSIVNQSGDAVILSKEAAAKQQVNLILESSYDNSGNINSSKLLEQLWQIADSIQGQNGEIEKADTQLEDNDYPINITIDGITITIDKPAVGSETIPTPTLTSNGSWDGKINTPKLGNDMTAIAWNNELDEITPLTNEQWYDYADVTIEGINTSKWANAKTSDGSYWVWIPRYEYKLNEETQEIDISFIPVSQTEPSSGYEIHPAFQDGSDTNYTNGEWDAELSGIWVMKFEASNSGNKPKSTYGVSSWRSTTIGNMYSYSQTLDSTKGSHLMKNSEWGAIAYLSYSKYGRNGTEITINSSYYYTGGGTGDAYKTNIGQSSTGNITGIYDLNGGSYERMAAYISNGYSNLISNGSTFISTSTDGADTTYYQSKSTKYVTVYPYNSSQSSLNNYNAYSSVSTDKYGYGDAILEISTTASSSGGWYGDSISYPYSSLVFFIRGGYYGGNTSAGIFSVGGTSGSSISTNGFRVVLAF